MPNTMISFSPVKTSALFLFAHGAGAPMDSDFMESVSSGLAENGIQVVRFEFPYMEKRRIDGRKRPPDRQPALIASFTEAINSTKLPNMPIFIGGKSMGGRMATLLATNKQIVKDHSIAGCICFGYPFHAPGKPMGNRMDHFADISQTLLICQGTRDPFGGHEEFSDINLPSNISIEWIQDGDHDLKPRKASGRTHADNIAHAISCATQVMVDQKL